MPANLILRRKGKSLLVVVDNQVVLELDNFFIDAEAADKPAYLINERCIEGETLNAEQLDESDLITANSALLKQEGAETGLIWEACEAGANSTAGDLASALGVTENQLLWGGLGLLGAGGIGAAIGGFGGGKKSGTPASAPAAPTADVAASSDTGVSNSDNLTNDTTPTITGTGTPGDRITLYAPDGTTQLGTATVDAQGHWAITPSSPLAEGLNNLKVTATDTAGKISAPTTVPVTIDTHITQIADPSNPPLTGGYPTVALAATSDSGVQGDNVTNDTTPTLTGAHATPGDTITIYDANNNPIASAIVAADGTWSATPATALPFGLNNLTIQASDLAGNVSTAIPLALTITKDLIIEGSLTLGEVKFGQVMVYAYDDQGNELGHDLIDKPETSDINNNHGFTGFHIEVANKGNYHGAILLKVVDGDSVDVNYQDEVTGADKSLNTTFRALAFANTDNSQYSDALSPQYNYLEIHISPLTELVVRQAGVSGDSANVSATTLNVANTLVADVFFGTNSNINLTQQATATNSTNFDGTDGVNSSEKLGLALAKLSGLDQINQGDAAITLNQLSSNLQQNNTTAAKQLIDDGRAAALTALKANDTTFTADTLLNRQLLGDVQIQNQTVDNSNKLTLVGNALPGASITVEFADGSTQTTTADAQGHYAVTSANALNNFTTTITSQDALTQPVDKAAPQAPAVVADNGHIITGTGEPGTVVTVADSNGAVIGTATVAANGSWQLLPATPLTVGTVVKAIATTIDTIPDASAPNHAPVSDNMVLGVPTEALDGIISSSDLQAGVSPLQVFLPSGVQAGDVITTTLTKPDGTTVLIPTTLTAADIVAGVIAQTIPETALSVDGTYSVDSVLTGTGITPPITVHGELIVDTTAPSLGQYDVANSSDSGLNETPLDPAIITNDTTPTINGQGAEPGATISVTTPSGETLTTTVKPNGTWSVTPNLPLPEGLNNLQLTATDAAGNSSQGSLAVLIDSSAPLISITSSASTNDPTPVITGTCSEANTPVSVTIGGATYAVTTDANGNWSLDTSTAIPSSGAFQPITDGSAPSPITATVTDKAGNVGNADKALLIDVTGIGVSIPEAADGYINQAEVASNGGVPVLTALPAAAVVGDIVTTVVTAPNGSQTTLTTILTSADIASGQISQTIPSSFLNSADGRYQTSTGFDSINGVDKGPISNSFVVDTQAPTISVDVIDSSDSGINEVPGSANFSATITNDTTPTIGGTGTAGDKITVTSPTGEVLTTTVKADGTWAVTLSQPLADGSPNIPVMVQDPAGNIANYSVPLVIDTTALAPTAILDPTSDSGTLGDGVTSDTTPTISGSGATPGDTITLYAPDGTTPLGTAVVSAQGSWAITPTTPLTDGLQNLSVTATDPAGNESLPTAVPVTIDTTAPAAPLGDVAAPSDTGISAMLTTLPPTPHRLLQVMAPQVTPSLSMHQTAPHR